MKVLIGVDGSSNSLATVAFVGRLLSLERDELILSYVSPPMPFVGDDQLDPGVAARAQAALSGAVFDEAVTRLPPPWKPRVERAELTGSPSAGLLAAAEDRHVDLIAVGFRGAGLFERFMLGSVSRAVVESALVPVLVVKAGEVAAATGGGEAEEQTPRTNHDGLRVLAAYDGPEMGAQIAAVAAHIAWPTESRGWVMTVIQPMFIHELPAWMQPITRDDDVRAMAEAWQKEHEQQLAQAGDELRKFQQTLPPCFQDTKPVVAEGRAGEELLSEMAEQEIDLAIVGSRGRGAVARLLLGSTSDQVLTHAPCSVLIVR
jgi:nucleotide-binding universal stress UspA family protein